MPAHSDRGSQHSARLTFVDPKGLRNLDLPHPKLGLYKEIRALVTTLNKQAKPGEPRLVLNASVLSPTKVSDLLNVGGPAKKQELEDRHVLFMEDERNKGTNTWAGCSRGAREVRLIPNDWPPAKADRAIWQGGVTKHCAIQRL